MSAVVDQETAAAWTAYAVPTFNGQHDTHIETGEDYRTITLGDLFTMEPSDKAKGSSPAFLPSLYADYDARNHAKQREHGRFVALTADIDKGNHAPAKVQAAVKAFAGDAAYLIYSSAHARPGDMRWRVVLPLDEPCAFSTWYDAQTALYAFMASRGIECDYALARAAQPVYLPNVPKIHAKTETPLRDDQGAALYYKAKATALTAPGLSLASPPVSEGIAAIRARRAADEQERERMRREAEKRRASMPRGDGASIIDDFNASNSVATMLELCGYEQSPRSEEDWRSPHQTGETYATRVMGSKWFSLSQSDVSAGVGHACREGCFGDAYDLYVHYKHGGDHRAAYRQLGEERRGNNVVPFPTPEPPEWMAEAPLPEPDDLGPWDDAEPDYLELVEAQPAPASMLPFFWFNDAEPCLEANDFVEGLLTSGSMSVVYGPSNCGKTFFIVDLALHVAWGRSWRGREVDRGAIVYLSLEGAQGIRNRLAAFRRHYQCQAERLPFVAMPKPVNLLDNDADVHAVIELVKHVAAETGLNVAMVIIDTLSRAMAGGNENSPEDMTALIGNVDAIRHATGSHVCIVHHSGKDEARGARGHSSLRAATDTEIEIKRDPELTFSSVRIAKQRDLEAGDPFNFTLQSVALGDNRRGKPVTSCVVMEPEQGTVVGRTPERLSEKEQAALEGLERCLLTAGFETVTGRNSGPCYAVTVTHWRKHLESIGVTEANNRDVSRVQFHRIRKALVSKGKIGWEGEVVWLA